MDLSEIRERLLHDYRVRDMIARRAFEIYVSNGYRLGRDFENWLEAEREILESMLDSEMHRLALAQAALEPEVNSEESVTGIEFSEIAAMGDGAGTGESEPEVQASGVEVTDATEEKTQKRTKKASATTSKKAASKVAGDVVKAARTTTKKTASRGSKKTDSTQV